MQFWPSTPSDCIAPPPVPNGNHQQPPKQRHQKFVHIEKPNWTRLAGQDTTGHNIVWTGKIGPFGRVARFLVRELMGSP